MTGMDESGILHISEPRRGDVWYADIVVPGKDELPAKARPVVVVSNDVCNANSPHITVVPLTTQVHRLLPTHVIVPNSRETGLRSVSVAKAENIMPLKKKTLIDCVGELPMSVMQLIDNAVLVQLGLR